MLLSRYERMIARRYLLPGKGEGFIFLVASISLVAVALGVAALIIVMSVMNGFRAELFDKIVGLNGHAVVQGYDGRLSNWQQLADQARKTPGVTSAIPLIEQPLMATANGRFEGVLVRGMRIEDIRANKTIMGNVRAGDMKSITPGSGTVPNGVVWPCGLNSEMSEPTCAPSDSASREPIAIRPEPCVIDWSDPISTLSWIVELRRMSSTRMPRTSAPSKRPLAVTIKGCSMSGKADVTPGCLRATSAIRCQSASLPS